MTTDHDMNADHSGESQIQNDIHEDNRKLHEILYELRIV